MKVFILNVDEDNIILSQEFYLLEEDVDKNLYTSSEDLDYIKHEVTEDVYNQYVEMMQTLVKNDYLILDLDNQTITKKNKMDL